MADLYGQLRNCDGVLEKMEQMLATFQNSLGDTAEEIKKLQDQSFTMNIKLSNRKKAATSISDFLQKIIITPRLISEINSAIAVDDRYLSPILELDALLTNFQQLDRKMPAFEELEPQLTSLTKTAVGKLKSFMEAKMKEMGNTKNRASSSQVQIQFNLLRYKYFYEFLDKYSPQSGSNIRKHYTNILGTHYLNSFKNYIASLQKRFPKAFVSESVKNNTIVELNTFSLTNLTTSVTGFNLSSLSMSNVTNNMSSLWSSSDKTSKTEKFFDLGDRFEKIDNNHLISLDMPPQQADLVDFTELWTSALVLLTNTITSEYGFILDFFGQSLTEKDDKVALSKHAVTISEVFSQTFSNSFSHLCAFTENYTSQTWDSVGILLLIRKINDFKDTMKKRDTDQEPLNLFWRQLEDMLWDRFHLIFDKNVISIHQLVENDYKAVTQNKTLVTREKTNFLISKKYAQWITSIYRLGLGQKLEQDLVKLSETFKGILIQMGKCSKNAKLGGDIDHVLIVNCADQILGLFIAYGIENEITQMFVRLLNDHVEQLISRSLNLPAVQMSKLITFISQANNLVSAEKSLQNNRQALSVDITLNGAKKSAYVHLDTLINEFNNYWQSSLSQMYSIISSQFANVGTARNVMERAVIAWMRYFRQFGQIIEAVFGKSSSQLVAESKVTFELRKYNTN